MAHMINVNGQWIVANAAPALFGQHVLVQTPHGQHLVQMPRGHHLVIRQQAQHRQYCSTSGCSNTTTRQFCRTCSNAQAQAQQYCSTQGCTNQTTRQFCGTCRNAQAQAQARRQTSSRQASWQVQSMVPARQERGGSFYCPAQGCSARVGQSGNYCWAHC